MPDNEQPEALSGGIAAVMARIQQRATVLSDEQAALKDTQNQVAALEKKYQKEKQRRQDVRTKYLTSVVDAHQVELKALLLQAQVSERRTETETLLSKKQAILQELESRQEDWATNYEPVLVEHQLRQEMYEKHLLGSIEERRRAMHDRSQKLETIQTKTLQLEHNMQALKSEQQTVQAEMMETTEQSKSTSHSVEGLAVRVRDALKKRSELRASLRDAQEKYQTAHNQADQLAQEYQCL